MIDQETLGAAIGYVNQHGGGGGGTSDYSALNNKPQINGVELSGNKTTGDLNISYDDLKNKPSIPSAQIQSDWNQTDSSKADFIKNKPSIPDDLADLNDDTSHRTVSDTEKSTWNGKSDFSGDYNDLQNKPTIPDPQVQADWNQTDNTKADFIKNKPSVPSEQVQSDWAQTTSTEPDYIKNKPSLGTAAAKSVPASGDAGSGEVVMGSDSRLSDDRNAKDVYSWAKASTKPTYTATEVGAIPSTDKGANGGVAELDSNGKVPSSQLPSYVDDVLSYASQSAFPATGETGKIYIAEDTNKTYRWSGSVYAEISESLALGETSSTAYRGDRGKAAYDHSQTTGNPHGTTKSDVGLSNVPNVSTNNQTPTFSQASTRNNISSGEKLSVIFGKIQKFFNDLKTVAFTGSYNDLTDKPTIPDAQIQSDWNQTTTTALDYIKNKPTIPAAQVNSDWSATSGVAQILNKPSSYTPSSHTHGNIQNAGTLQTTDVAIANGDKLVVTDASNSAKVARTSLAFDGSTTTQALSKKGTFETFSKFSGSYNDLSNKPTIPTTANDISYDNTDSGLTATDVQGAVDELAESYPADKVMMSDGVTSVEDALDAVMPKTVTSVTADGVKTYAQLLTELFNLGSGGNVLKIGNITFHVTNQANYSACYFGGENAIDVYAIYMKASIALYKKFSITSGGTVTFTNLSDNIPTSGIKIEKVRI